MQAHAISGPVGGRRAGPGLRRRTTRAAPRRVRYARRLADRLRAPWTALHVETPRSASMPEEDKDRLAANLRLAEQLGREVTTIPGQNVAQPISCAMRRRTTSPTSSSAGRRGRAGGELIEGSLTYDLIRNAGDISVHVISGTERSAEASRGASRPPTSRRAFQIRPYLMATAYVAGVACLRAVLLDQFLDVRNLALVFLIGGAGLGGDAAVCGRRCTPVVAQRPCLQLLLPRAALHADDPRSGKHRRARLLPGRRGHRQQSHGARCSARPSPPAHGRGPPKISICSPRSSPVPARSTTCCGPPPSRSPRC